MEVENDVQEVIDKINSGGLNELISQVDGTEFGVYLPVFEDQGIIKKMFNGYSQVERDLLISISQGEAGDDALPIGWFRNIAGKDSSCRHGGTASCSHCTTHTDTCRHCTSHANSVNSNPFNAPELDYPNIVQAIEEKQDLLDKLAQEGLGLTLLHGHSADHMFTKLPPEYVSVIANGKTEFRLESNVVNDATFVPSTWRVVNGELKVSGGHSQLASK